MKIIAFLILLFVLSLNSYIFSQELNLGKKISLNEKEIELTELLNKIFELASIDYSHSPDLIKKETKVTVKYTNKSIKVILDEVLKDHNLDFEVHQGYIQIVKAKSKPIYKNKSPRVLSHKKTIIDTIVTNVFDTILITKIDSVKVYYIDTIPYYDTLTVLDSSNISQAIPKKRKLFKLIPVDVQRTRYIVIPNNWDLVLNIAPHYCISSKIENSTSLNDYDSEISNGISDKISYSVDVGLSSFFYENWRFYIGVGYTFLYNTFKAYPYIDTTYGQEYTEITSESTSFYPFRVDTLYTTYINSSNIPENWILCDHRFSYIHIPFKIFFQVRLNRKFNFNIGAGIHSLFLIKATGVSLKNNGQLFKMDKTRDLKKFIIGYTYGFDLDYTLTIHFKVVAGVSGLYYPGEFFKNTVEYDQKKHYLNLKLGLKYNFNLYR